MTLNNSWGYRKDDDAWKTPDVVIKQLIEVTAKGGSFLLNVGPNSEGLISKNAENILQKVGKWLQINGEAIYGASPTNLANEGRISKGSLEKLRKYEEQQKIAKETGADLGEKKGDKEDSKKIKKPKHLFKEYDWQSTTKGNKLYIHVFDSNTFPASINGLKQKVKRAYFLADTSKSVEYEQKGDVLTITLPKKMVGDIVEVLCFEF